MYIQPNSEIRIIRNVGFNNSYTDTVYFETAEQQYDYFHAREKYVLSAQYYCRVNDGVLKVEKPIQDLQDCNYLMFRNISFGNKWFYAFITSVEYINNETSRITFELDVMQTYFFDVTLRQCLVEREHSATDAIGDNLQDEPFDIADYVYQSFEEVGTFTDVIGNVHNLDELVVVVAYARNYTYGQRVEPYSIIDGTIQCADLFMYTIDQTGALALGKAIDQIVDRNQIDNILDIYCVPLFTIPTDSNGQYIANSESFLTPSLRVPVQQTGRATQFGLGKPTTNTPFIDVKGGQVGTNYLPRNNKLYTYPFCCFEMSTPMGQKVQYAFEDFDGEVIYLTIMGTMTNPVQLSIYPCYYKRIAPETIERIPANNEGALTIANYPKSAFSSDAFKAWLAQNSVPIIVDTIMSVVGGALTGMALGGAVGGAVGGTLALEGGVSAINSATIGAVLGGAKSTIGHTIDAYKASRTSDSTRGTINNGSNLHAHQAYVFNLATKHVPNQIAKIIDDKFTMFGYACNEVKEPNRHVRKHCTYTKTIGCNAQGRCPSDDIAKICSIYDNGIRFWDRASIIGFYGDVNDRNYNAPIEE